MKLNRKILGLAIALIMLFSSTIPAFAAMPIDTVIVGNKAYDFEYFQNNTEAIVDVQAALDAGENVYVKFDGGILNVVINEFLENSEELPEVEYYDKDGNVTRYEAGDGDPVESEFKVIEISAIEAITVTVGDDVDLPETVEVTLNDGNEEEEIEATVVEVAVEWEEFVAEEEGEFTVNGTIVLPEDAEFTISEELAAVTVTVVVEEAALEVVEVSAINGKVTVEFDKEVTELPEGLVVLKDDEVLELEEDAFEVVEGKVEVTVPEIEATFEEQSIVYSVQLGEAEAVAADALVIEASDELGVTDVLAEVDEKAKEVTVTATVHNAEEEATATVAIFAYDEEGELVEDAVVPAFEVEIDEEGNIKEEIDVKELKSGNYKVEVTVTQVVEEEEVTAKDEFNFELDFKAVDAAVEAVNKADTQIKLKSVLEKEPFEGFNIDLLAKYEEKLGQVIPRNFDTVAEIQDIIDEVNETTETATEFATIVEALNGAKNDYEVYIILNEYFERVNDENINEYVAKIFNEDGKVNTTSLTTKAEIQLEIDTVNATVAVDALFETKDTKLAKEVTQADIDAAKALVEVLKEKEENVTDYENSIKAAQKLFDDANAAAPVIEMIKALPKADEITKENIDQVKPLVVAARAAYSGEDGLTEDQQKFVETDVLEILTAAEGKIEELEQPLTNALSAVNTATSKQDMITAITTNAETLGLATGEDSDYAKLVNYPSESNSRHWAVGVDLVNNRPEEGYTLEELQAIFNDIVATRLVTQVSMDLVNEVETVEDFNGIEYVVILLNRFKETNYKQHSSHQIADRIIYLQDLVDDYNALSEEYQEEVLQAVIDGRPADGYARSQATFDPLESALEVATINYAIETENGPKLQELIVENNVEAYIKLPRAQRGEVVEYLIATTEEAFDTVDKFETEVSSAITAYETLLSDVNSATDKTDMVGKLGAIKYDAFDNLTAVQKLDVAEEILAMVKAEGDDKVEFETLAQIRAAVDAVMVELGY